VSQSRGTALALSGVWFGLAASLAWAIYNVGTKIGRTQGFSTAELTLMRYLGGAVVMVPLMVLMRKPPMQGLSWGRIATLTLVAGPPFAWFFTTGFSLAPLSHGVVISPSMTMVVASLLSRFVDGHRLSRERLVGMALLLGALIVIGADQGSGSDLALGDTYWLGDLCFVMSGTCWGIFTWLMARWRLDPVSATGTIAIASTGVFLPVFFVVAEPSAHSLSQWAWQTANQGALGGALAIVWYNAAVKRMGQAAGIFPALVPPLAILIAVPMTGNLPNLLQIGGIGIASLGLMVSLNLSGQLSRFRSRGPDRGKVLK